VGHGPRLAAVIAALALGLGASGCGDDPADENTGPAEPEQPLSPVEEQGRDLFTSNCGSCHTLDAAGTTGTVGPDLDEVQADQEQVLEAIETGAGGSGVMPENLVEGEDARAVAIFVANSGPGV
jgi:mono/diheme cytochrome c family protein